LTNRLPCVNIAALGAPAVPLVKIAIAIESRSSIANRYRRLAVERIHHRLVERQPVSTDRSPPLGDDERAPTRSISRCSSAIGESGLSGTTTAPTPSAAR
jgi:hypothetical protein